MADNDELQTARIIGGGPGSSIDDNYRDVEAAMRTIFGITADADYSEAMQVAASGDITMTGTLTLDADPTEDLMIATKQFVDNAPGSGANVRCTLVLSSGQVISDGNTDALGWDAAHIEAGGECWDVGDPTKLIFPVAGDYIIGAVIAGVGDGAAPYFNVSMRANGSTWLYTNLGLGKGSLFTSDVSADFAVMERMSIADYIEIFVTVIGSDHTMSTTCYLWAMKVGGIA